MKLAVLAERSPEFRVKYEARRGAGDGAVVCLEAFDARAETEWTQVGISAELVSALAGLPAGVVADQVTSVVDAGLAPTSLDVTAQFVRLLLEPEKLAPMLLAKVMGIFAYAVAMHFGLGIWVARCVRSAVERWFGTVSAPAGARGKAAEAVERFTVAK